MNLAEMLAGLREERDQIDEMILGFERLSRMRGIEEARRPAGMALITSTRRRTASVKSKTPKANGIIALA
jgi:hypothetical protein